MNARSIVLRDWLAIKTLQSALDDIKRGVDRRRVWIALATEDIFDQHRRTTLGPLWLLLNYFAFCATFIFIFAPTPRSPSHAAYVAAGLLIWTYVTDSIIQAVTLFEREESLIRGTILPISVYVMRLVLQNLIRSGYALIGCAIIMFISGESITISWFFSIFGLFIVVFISPAIVLCFAFLGVFFPDSQFIVANLMRVAMFATPVFWSNAGSDPLLRALYYWNPFTYFLMIVRDPIVSGDLPVAAMEVCFAMTLLFWGMAVILLGRFRRRVALIV